jgi:hypothetical protein
MNELDYAYRLAMSMSYEDLFYLPHLHSASLELMLRRFSTVKQPHIALKPECKSGMIASRRGLR